MTAAELLTAMPQPCYRVDLDGVGLALRVGETRTVTDVLGEANSVRRTS